MQETCEVTTTINQYGDEVREPVIPRTKFVKTYARTFSVGDRVRFYSSVLKRSVSGVILYAKEKKFETYRSPYIVSGYMIREDNGDEHHASESSLFTDRYGDYYEGYC